MSLVMTFGEAYVQAAAWDVLRPSIIGAKTENKKALESFPGTTQKKTGKSENNTKKTKKTEKGAFKRQT